MFRESSILCYIATTRIVLNFFPLGYVCGPKNKSIVAPLNNFEGKVTNYVPPVTGDAKQYTNFVHRNKLKLYCEHCKFAWLHDTLTVRCPANPDEHNQREIWLPPTWMWGKQQPYKYYDYMPVSVNPRTNALLAREDAKSMNNERRSQGLTTYTRRVTTDHQGMSRAVSGIGMFNQRWKTRFPFPT